MLPAVVDVLQLVVDLRLLGLVAGCNELLSELLQVSFVLAEQVDLFHAILMRGTHNKENGMSTCSITFQSTVIVCITHLTASLQDSVK